MESAKYGTGDKVLLQATIKSAEVITSLGKERVLYKIEESDIPIQEEIIIEKDDDWSLADLPTAFLVKELEKREAVSVIYAEPYQDVKYSVNGPAEILIITD